jgi:predicted O-linked N-acetylglucosamine transferase (SPINDLY family)
VDAIQRLIQEQRLPEAKAKLQKLLASQRRNTAAWLMLGSVNRNLGDRAEAGRCFERVIALDPRHIEAHYRLGNLHAQAGEHAAAIPHYQEVLALSPDHAQAVCNLGLCLQETGRADEAIAAYRRFLQHGEPTATLCFNLAHALGETGAFDEAVVWYDRTLALEPSHFDARKNLAMALNDSGRDAHERGDLRRALALYQRGIALVPAEASPSERGPLESSLAVLYANLGSAFLALGMPAEAEASCRRALALDPSKAYINLGNVLKELGRVEESAQCYREAIKLEPSFAMPYSNLGHALMALGRLEEAEEQSRKAIVLDPDWAVAYSNLAMVLNCMPGRSPEEIFELHAQFGRQFERPSIEPHANSAQPERRLRIGYVSSDLRGHSVAFFIEPVLAKHERRQFEVFCYYNLARVDHVTERLKGLVDHWRDVPGISEDLLAQRIRSDAIDILVDLTGHTGSNRLLTFARKPAPVQATWLGYLNTTGLKAVDWRITDARATPEGRLDGLHSERVLRLPDSQWCYQPPADCPEVGPSPSATRGYCTFAAFSVPSKINTRVMTLWSRILEGVPGSRLVIIATGLFAIPPAHREPFRRAGIADDRLELLPSKDFAGYMAFHNEVDLMLDTFPYTGGTTTCHALWMGVPIVSLVGETATSRGGASLLHALGMPELIAADEDEYVKIAVGLARDPQRLAALRAGLRARMAASPLTDAERFTRNLENAYRTMWREWCAQRS